MDGGSWTNPADESVKSDTYFSWSDTSAYIKPGSRSRPAGVGWVRNEGWNETAGQMCADTSAQHMCVFVVFFYLSFLNNDR